MEPVLFQDLFISIFIGHVILDQRILMNFKQVEGSFLNSRELLKEFQGTFRNFKDILRNFKDS